MYRDAHLLVESSSFAGGDASASASEQQPSPPPASILACHAALTELFAHIEPECLRDSTSLVSAAVSSAPDPTAESVRSHAAAAVPTMQQLQRVQWYRLLEPLLQATPSSADSAAMATPVRLHFNQGGGHQEASGQADRAKLVTGIDLWG
jgi:hypothetical protein